MFQVLIIEVQFVFAVIDLPDCSTQSLFWPSWQHYETRAYVQVIGLCPWPCQHDHHQSKNQIIFPHQGVQDLDLPQDLCLVMTQFFLWGTSTSNNKKIPNKWIRLAEQQTRLISVFKKSGVFVFEYWVTKGVKTNMSKNTSTYEIASFSSLHPPHQKRGSFWDNLCGNSFPASCALWHFSCDFARVAVIFQHLTFAEDTAKVLKGFIDVFGI